MQAPLEPVEKELGGGFTVQRSLPHRDRRSVGPFVFFDHFGPVTLEPGPGHDVRPHPHIGLATFTYLFEGAILHRDSLGSVQKIEPGAVNWMSAGRGIVHSERTPKDQLGERVRRHGLQLWVALPEDLETSSPTFQHVAAADIPVVAVEGATVRVVVGSAHGATSPVRTLSPTIVLVYDMAVASGTEVEVPPLASELALFAVDHPIEIDGEKVDEFRLAPLEPGRAHRLAAPRGGRVVLVGGEPLGHRHLAWNFVSSSLDRIRAAEADWRAQRFPSVPGETEFIPLPEKPRAPTFQAPN